MSTVTGSSATPSTSSTHDLVLRARVGDSAAWTELVEQFAPLLWSVCRRYRLADADADDVVQSVWLRLLEHLSSVREPAALPGWLATTTARECLRTLRAQGDQLRREAAVGDEVPGTAFPSPDDAVVAAERTQAVRAAFDRLPQRCRRLLGLLAEDPPLTYAEIGQRLDMPVGALGPTRARCLGKLRGIEPLASLIERDADPDRRRR